MKVAPFFCEIIVSVMVILRNKKNAKYKIRLLLLYLKLMLKYLFLFKLFGMKLKKEKFFGYNLNFFDYKKITRSLFRDLFVFEEYNFDSSGKKPFIIDCGSNVGMSILFFKINYPESKILGFEPDKKTFQVLKENIVKNKITGVDLVNAAVYNKEGKITFYSVADEECSPGCGITKRMLDWGKNFEETKANSTRLSKYINKPVDLLKIDIEGAEECVIEELYQGKKLHLIKEIIMEYHYSKDNLRNNSGRIKNNLGRILFLLEKSNFKFVLESNYKPPYFFHKNKPLELLIFAYK